MKNAISLLTFLFLYILAFGQNDKPKPLSEIGISANRTLLENQNTKNGNGFGIGLYQYILDNEKTNLTFGLEFNMTSQLIKSMYHGHSGHTTDVEFYFYWFSIPLTTRIYFGERVKFFVEPGIFIDIPIYSREKGTLHIYSLNDDNQIEYTETEYDYKSNEADFNYGLSLGLGIIIPISNVNLIIKPDYKLGLKSIGYSRENIYNRYFRITVGMRL